MKTIELLGHVDERHHLSAEAPQEVPPGPVRIAIVLPSDPTASDNEETDTSQWMIGVSREWFEEMNDPREDIYTLADGEPVRASG